MWIWRDALVWVCQWRGCICLWFVVYISPSLNRCRRLRQSNRRPFHRFIIFVYHCCWTMPNIQCAFFLMYIDKQKSVTHTQQDYIVYTFVGNVMHNQKQQEKKTRKTDSKKKRRIIKSQFCVFYHWIMMTIEIDRIITGFSSKI